MPLPTIQFAAPIIRAALATLRANLPGQVALFNAEPANTVDLAAPADNGGALGDLGVAYVFGAADPLTAYGFPLIEVAVMEGRSGNASIDFMEFDHNPRVNVVCWHEGDRGELATTYEMSLGLARCVIECLIDDDAFGPGLVIRGDDQEGGGIFWRADALPADIASDEREFKKWQVPVFLQFEVEAVERRT